MDDPAKRRRTVYARISRLKLNDQLMQFDYPDANVHAEQRSVTTTPMQKLFMLNSPFMQRQAEGPRRALARGAERRKEIRVTLAYRLLFLRANLKTEERALALAFLSRPSGSDMNRWEQYAQTLLASNEMLYVD